MAARGGHGGSPGGFYLGATMPSKYKVLVSVRSVLVKSFVVDADCWEDAHAMAESQAEADVNSGDLTGWDMTTETEVFQVSIESTPQRCADDY